MQNTGSFIQLIKLGQKCDKKDLILIASYRPACCVQKISFFLRGCQNKQKDLLQHVLAELFPSLNFVLQDLGS